MFKTKIFFAVLLFIGVISISYKEDYNKFHKIVYECSFELSDIKLPDSIDLISIIPSGDTVKTKIASPMRANEITYRFLLNLQDVGDSMEITFDNSKIDNNSFKGNMPDRIVLKNDIWYTYEGTRVKVKPAGIFESVPTDEYKTILNYKCRKYVINDRVNNSLFFVWLTNEIPGNLSPASGYKLFDGTALELAFPQNKLLYRAVSIK